jgi:hypothetical protein
MTWELMAWTLGIAGALYAAGIAWAEYVNWRCEQEAWRNLYSYLNRDWFAEANAQYELSRRTVSSGP